MRDLKQGRDGATEEWRQGRHLNTCRGGEHDKHVCFNVWTSAYQGGCGCVSHCECVCVCLWRGVYVYTVNAHECVLCANMWGSDWVIHWACSCVCMCEKQNGNRMWICLLVLSVLAWWHLSVKVLLGWLTWLQRDKVKDLMRATCSLLFPTECKA